MIRKWELIVAVALAAITGAFVGAAVSGGGHSEYTLKEAVADCRESNIRLAPVRPGGPIRNERVIFGFIGDARFELRCTPPQPEGTQ